MRNHESTGLFGFIDRHRRVVACGFAGFALSAAEVASACASTSGSNRSYEVGVNCPTGGAHPEVLSHDTRYDPGKLTNNQTFAIDCISSNGQHSTAQLTNDTTRSAYVGDFPYYPSNTQPRLSFDAATGTVHIDAVLSTGTPDFNQ